MLGPIPIHSGSVGRPRLVPAAAGLLVVLAGTLLGAGEAPDQPTLEQIKGDLKTIKRDNNAAAGQDTSLSTVALPGLRASPDSSSSPAPARPAPATDAAPDDRRRADPNWLLNGVELQNKARAAARPRAAGAKRDETPLVDVSDPTFMLRLYLAQPEARPAADEARARDAAADPSAQPGVGSFDIYLSQWVSKRDPALRGLIEAASATPAGPGASGPPVWQALTVPAPESTPAAPNPFLAAFSLESPGPAHSAPAAAPPSPLGPPPAVASTPAPADSPARTPPAPPPNPADDKKYFPQLNRF